MHLYLQNKDKPSSLIIMVAISEIGPLPFIRSTQPCSLRLASTFTHSRKWLNLRIHSRFKSSATGSGQNPNFAAHEKGVFREFRVFNSTELDRSVTSDEPDDEGEMRQGVFEAIEELERMTREPSQVLEEMHQKLSARDLQFVLVYFSQEGRDSWCALEVFDWLRKENRVDKKTMKLMVSIMYGWVKKLIDSKSEVSDVVDLLVDMDCVGLKPGFSMMKMVVSLYWEAGEKERAIGFVKEVLRRQISYSVGDTEGHKGCPVGFLAYKMMEEGNYRDAVKLVINIKGCGLKPDAYSYLIAMSAVLKELKEFGKALQKLKSFTRSGLVVEIENFTSTLKYQTDLLADGVRLSDWAFQEGDPSLYGTIHERLLTMYICSRQGVEAEKHIWQIKLEGKEVNRDLYDIVLAICASQNESGPIGRLLTIMDTSTSLQKKKSLSWLIRGYIKGGHSEKAAETVMKMLDLGLTPAFLDRVVVLQGLQRRIRQPGGMHTYLKLCKRLSDAELVDPCIVYLYIKKHKLWIMTVI
ncbi:hypothetical protein DM860_012123 [Cuscuta australis]|uniref:Pentacotripeptide-repeat region of PRORP domain-containing protein n=1 Tax=Cuscuta australis TaxID=267555 RepID=A0A328DAY9_9ASTE|nr:hypothetical protein DM860_012123 [Cuscuta australis]